MYRLKDIVLYVSLFTVGHSITLHRGQCRYLPDFHKVGKDHSYDSFIAPTTGIHGWFWENKGSKQVDIHLTTAGFYDSAKMYVDGKPEELEIQDAK